LFFVVGWAGDTHARSAGKGKADVHVRTIYHKDGGRTVSKKNNGSLILEELTYDNRNVLIMKKRFQLDSKDRVRQGQLLDAADNILARIQYGFDTYGRVEEERMFDTKGNVIRRLLYKYDSNGKRLKPKAYTFHPNSKKPIPLNPDSVAPTIMTPDINGGGRIPGVRYEEGEAGFRSAPAVNPRSSSRQLRGGDTGIRR